jgi:hypothetical protein
MDPDAAFRELFDAVEAGDRDRVTELIDGLNAWLSKGGYPPKTLGPWKLGMVWHVAVAKAVFRLAKAHVRVVASRKTESPSDPPSSHSA